MRKNLRQIVFRVLHHHVKQDHFIELAASGLKQPEQVGVRQFRSHFPACELNFDVRWISGNELYRGPLRVLPAAFRQEHSAVLRSAQVLAEWEVAIHYLALPLFPVTGHLGSRLSAVLHSRYCKRAFACAGRAKRQNSLILGRKA